MNIFSWLNMKAWPAAGQGKGKNQLKQKLMVQQKPTYCVRDY